VGRQSSERTAAARAAGSPALADAAAATDERAETAAAWGHRRDPAGAANTRDAGLRDAVRPAGRDADRPVG